MAKANIAPENKDAYYTIKNNDHIDWRKLLVLFEDSKLLIVDFNP
jgi:hypothetical protein